MAKKKAQKEVTIEITPADPSQSEIIKAEILKWTQSAISFSVVSLQTVGDKIKMVVTSLIGKSPEALFDIISERICRFCRSQCVCPQTNQILR